MENILDFFDVDEENIVNPIGSAAQHYLDNQVKSEGTEIDTPKKKKPKTIKISKSAKKISKVKWKYKDYRINRVNHYLMEVVDIIGVTFIDKGRGLSGEEEIQVKIDKSWIGLLGFLIGVIHEKYGSSYLNILSSFGVFNESIQSRKVQPVYLDQEVKENLSLYKIEHLGLIIEYRNNLEDLKRSISRALKALEISEQQVKVTLYNPNYIDKSKKNSVEPLEVNTTETDTEPLEVNTTETDIELNDTLDRLNNEIISSITITKVAIDGEIYVINNNQHAISYILSYLIIFYEDIAIKVLENNTIKDVIGVTRDEMLYLGIIKKTKLPNSDLYFYYNGNIEEAIKYIYNVCDEIGVDQSSINIYYKLGVE